MKKDIYIKIIDILKEYYPESKCTLDFKTPFELLVSVMLSAQCTDERVNKTTPNIFSKYNTPIDFVDLDLNIIEQLIKSCGFYKTKAKHIKEASIILVNNFDSIVPNNMDDLLTLPGIGRKSANVILLECYNICNGVAVDTHAKRLCNRIGFSTNSDPIKIEQDLINSFPKEYLKDINHLLVIHGRAICTARNPKCNICPINKYCEFFLNKSE